MARSLNHRRRLERLEAKAPPPPPEEFPMRRAELRRVKQLEQRLDQQLRAALAHMTAEEQEQVHKGLAEWEANLSGPFAGWLRDLCQGNCQLPDIAPGSLREVLLAWLSPQRDSWALVCRLCGMEYPTHKKPPLS